MHHKQMAISYYWQFDRKSHSVLNLNFDKIQKVDNQCEIGPLWTRKWLALFGVISLHVSPKPLESKSWKNVYQSPSQSH